ncbi:hypothetical protein BJ165DRAFT_1060084 [Panaeolus papilionaceus]|nr:hypothetical protein BJ165DRAFT_1060084 [Panaeolus papilionaceus]
MSFFSVKPRTKEEKELDKRLQHFYEEREVYTAEPTVFDNFEEPHVERDEDVPHASVEIEDGHHEVHDEDYDGEEHDIIPHDQSISQEYLDQLVAKTIDHEAERIRELATAKEQIIDFMKEMHELSLKQEEERHKRRLEQDKERLLLYREYSK